MLSLPTGPIQHLLTSIFLPNFTSSSIRNRSTWPNTYFDDVSQSTGCIASRFWEIVSTLLNKLWYTYSYIYKMIIILILLTIVVMPTTKTIFISLDINAGIISPKPTARTRLFAAMSNFTPITNHWYSLYCCCITGQIVLAVYMNTYSYRYMCA